MLGVPTLHVRFQPKVCLVHSVCIFSCLKKRDISGVNDGLICGVNQNYPLG